MIAKPVLTRRAFPHLFAWVAPLLVAVFAGVMLYEYFSRRGPEVTIEFNDATGLIEGQTRVLHRGAEIGRVTEITLTDDHRRSLVHARLQKREDIFATKGAEFWIVRPEVSGTSFKGLDTLVSGAYIQASPGQAEENVEHFIGLEKEPARFEAGETYLLTTPRLGHAQEGAAVTYKGIPVGVVEGTELAKDATHVDVRIRVFARYAHLVRENSKFWIASGFDFKGGIFSGVHVQLDSLKTVVSGGVAFATPDKELAPRARAGAVFALEEDSKKDWESWSPAIPVSPRLSDSKPAQTALPVLKRRKK